MLPRRKTQSLIIAAIAALLVALPLSASGPAVAAAAAKKSSLHSKCPRQARKHRSKRRGKACRQSRGPEGGAGSQPTGAGGSAGAPTAAAAPGPPSPPETHAPPPGGSKEGPEVQPEPEPEAEPPIEPELEPEIERETEAEPEPELEVETSVKSAPKQESPLNTEPAPETSLLPFRFFSPTSFWNAEPGPTAPLDPESKALAGAFIAEAKALVEAGTGPWINTTNYSVPIVTVPASQPKVRVQLVSKYSAPALQAAWEEVPIPPTAKPASGTDGTLVVWQPATNKLWEFWRAAKTETGWQASWGGAVQNVSGAWGAYGPDAWPGAKPWWGSSASSLSIAGGLITLEDLAHGSIDHALSIAIPNVRAGVYSSPAMRTDGKSNSPLSLPEGARLRLDPSLDLTSLKLPPLTLMIARAAQRYGIFVRDRAKVIHFFAEDPSALAVNPYLGKSGYFEGRSPAQLLASFPWDRLQLLRMDLHEAP